MTENRSVVTEDTGQGRERLQKDTWKLGEVIEMSGILIS